MEDLFSFDIRPLIFLLNNNATGLGNPQSISSDHICKEARYMSLLV